MTANLLTLCRAEPLALLAIPFRRSAAQLPLQPSLKDAHVQHEQDLMLLFLLLGVCLVVAFACWTLHNSRRTLLEQNASLAEVVGSSHESEDILRAALSCVMESICILGMDGTIREFNEAFVGFHRFSSRDQCPPTAQQLRQLFDLRMLDGTLVSYDDRPIGRALRGQVGSGEMYKVRRVASGEEWLGVYSFSPIRRADGTQAGVTLVCRDVSLAKKNEEDLFRCEKRFMSLFYESAAVFLLVSPATGRILDANHSACRFYGYSRKQLLAMSIYDINTLSEGEIRTSMQSVDRERGSRFAFRHRLASGEVRDVEVLSSIVLVQGEQVYFSVVQDVTERNRSQLKLSESTGFLHEAQKIGQLGCYVLDVDAGT